ncbi:winged helix-turn-helix transcriptional regulator [Streptomyces sp. RPA4-5]|uniref:MarR family winged helix-turn-helix transcriptional regulator n=1 Tax=Streptomyces TaxID=1883 RepID=UPI00143ED10E|nr:MULTISPECIES: MarR family winged helix-turn-helix transcriptional regulator [Streptomyces]MCX4635090.1 MarR family winged helix-turn-helix transcriptional regulator [Streptomyces platensis]QIY58306.1 winged helix-turn-helix transcriptional regulator [Streptomyces sp. RPA4-5]WJY41513.1 MarR family winged helix-turn-helix transcriptional regulator [Streptomyces sp. P9-2B-2]
MKESTPPEPPHPAKDVTQHAGYLLKRAQAALRGAMDKVLREHGLTVPQYATLELLALHPGMSNADLARATFVTRQSGHVVLRGLQEAGLITRPATADHGRARPAHLTGEGHARLTAVQAAVYAVEQRMVQAIPPERMTALLTDLDRIAAALEE